MKTQFGTAGDVRDVDLLAAFVAFWRDRTGGVVSFVRAGGTAAFSLFEGEVVSVSSSEPRFESAAILIRAGKLDAPALERLGVPEGSDGALAALQAGILTKREWRWGEKIRAIEILADLLSWNDGKYYFDADARPASGEFNLAIPRLLLELFLRSRDRHFVDHQLGHTNVPLVRSEEFDREFTTFGLTADAESVARLIDGNATADEIAATAPADEFAVRKLLAALCTLGLVKPADRSAEPEMAVPPAPSWDALVTTPLASRAFEASPEAEPAPDMETEHERAREEDFEGESPREPAPRREMEMWRIPQQETPETAAREEPPLDEYPISDAPVSEIDGDDRSRESQDRSPAWDPLPAGESVASASDEPPPGNSRTGALFGGVLVALILAIGAFLYFRSRPVSSGGETAAAATTAVPTRAVVLVPTAGLTASVSPLSVAPLPGAAGARVATAPPAPRTTAARATPLAAAPRATALASAPPRVAAAGKPAAVASPRPTAAAPRAAAPAPAVAPGKPEASAPGRGSWAARAARDKKRLAAEKSTRFAIQLELVCETPSLVEAWKHDRPAGRMWLLTTTHGGRECFKVLWGRYPTLDAAKRAKAKSPAFFQTAANHPAVVRVK